MRQLDAELDLLVFGNKSKLLEQPWPEFNPPDYCRVDDEDTIIWSDTEYWPCMVPRYSVNWNDAEAIYMALASLVTNKSTPLVLSVGQFASGKVYMCRFEFAFAQADTPEMAIALCAKNYYTKVRNG